MSICSIQAVLDYDLPPREKLVMMVYANYANKEGEGVYPSIATMSTKTGYAKGTIRRVYGILEAAGLLIRNGSSRYQTIIWKVNMEWDGTREDVEKQVKIERAQRGARLTGDTLVCLTGGTDARLTGDTNPLREPKEEPVEIIQENDFTITPYRKLLTAYINAAKDPSLLGNIGKRDNEALVKMVDAGCIPEDIIASVKYADENGLTFVGPASALKGAIYAMRQRTNKVKSNTKRDRARPLPKGL